jgi:hypothetical protein
VPISPLQFDHSVTNNSIGDVSLGRYNKAPRMKIQKAENVNKALEFITSRGVKLTNIGSEGESILIISERGEAYD